MFLDKDGRVYACCHYVPQAMGDIRYAPLEQIRKGPAASELRRAALTFGTACFDSCSILTDDERDAAASLDSTDIQPLERLHVLFGEGCRLACVMCNQDHRSAEMLDSELVLRHATPDAETSIEIQGGEPLQLKEIRALSERYDRFGILQIDAHADLRKAYEGFTYSHASIMYNALKIKEVNKLVQVGIRYFCQEELDVIKNEKGRVVTFFDRDMKHAMYRGDSWDRVCNRIVKELPDRIYLSFDIDALDPKLCPNTGTPVAGGMEAEQVLFLIEKWLNPESKSLHSILTKLRLHAEMIGMKM